MHNEWFLIIGGLLVLMALVGSLVKRLPLSTSVIYLCVGFALGHHGLGLLRIDPLAGSGLLERLSEVAVIVSLFTAGLKLRSPLRDGRWHLPLRLATVSMAVTVGLVALVGVHLLRMPVGAAVLLGAVLAPTDPVLASDVQVEHPGDRDRLRFALTGEAGLNDGAAFPFVMLGLGLMHLHPLGAYGVRWALVDVLWATAAGLGIGAAFGSLIGKLVVYMRTTHREALGLDEFLTLGLIALSYGAALLAHAYGFLAVFAAGLALRRIERTSSERSAAGPSPPPPEALAAAMARPEAPPPPEHAPAVMAQAVLGFNEQLERLGEMAMVLLVAGMFTASRVPGEAAWFIPLLFLVIRPLAVVVGCIGSGASRLQVGFLGWFGIRGIGSIYYLSYAIQHGLPRHHAGRIANLVLTTIAASIIVHGVSVTPLMSYYERATRYLRERRSRPGGARTSVV
ncbi:MAG: cation:proton antiporter [Deltaproteobacteria bacterium]|nr:cation:proton antiporter [Myxococcales bacterium]MDP3220556.1 cation:proton antiporter [Deltaproteobacteria bacterium]